MVTEVCHTLANLYVKALLCIHANITGSTTHTYKRKEKQKHIRSISQPIHPGGKAVNKTWSQNIAANMFLRIK